MSAQHAVARQLRSAPRYPIAGAAPLAADTESGFARVFVPTLLAVLLATGCLGWDSWVEPDAPSLAMIGIAR
jgi:hypothetical protein